MVSKSSVSGICLKFCSMRTFLEYPIRWITPRTEQAKVETPQHQPYVLPGKRKHSSINH